MQITDTVTLRNARGETMMERRMSSMTQMETRMEIADGHAVIVPATATAKMGEKSVEIVVGVLEETVRTLQGSYQERPAGMRPA